MPKVLITGAGGFLGSATVDAFLHAGWAVTATTRQTKPPFIYDGLTWVCCVEPATLAKACAGMDTIVHLAAPASRKDTVASLGLSATHVAKACKDADVARVIYASSIYARLVEQGVDSDYGAIKIADENVFLTMNPDSFIALRFPPIYGHGAKGGFGILAKLVQKGLPIPFGSALAKRSYIARENAADLIVTLAGCADAQWASLVAQTYEPSDGQDISTRDLIAMLCTATGQKNRSIRCPILLLRALGFVAGKSTAIDAAISPLHAQDNAVLETRAGWVPKTQMPDSLEFFSRIKS